MPKAVIEDQFSGKEYRVRDLGSEEFRLETQVTNFVQVGWNKHVGTVDIVTREGGDFAAPDERGGFSVNLDRAGVNRLIRSLRTARDAAFGRDE